MKNNKASSNKEKNTQLAEEQIALLRQQLEKISQRLRTEKTENNFIVFVTSDKE